MKMAKRIMKKVGEKMANNWVEVECFPLWLHQPDPPAKIKQKMQERKMQEHKMNL